MPIVMCTYCQYIGQSEGRYRSYEKEIIDVEEHEKTCPARFALKEK